MVQYVVKEPGFTTSCSRSSSSRNHNVRRKMMFFSLSCPVGDEANSVQEIISHMKDSLTNSVEQLNCTKSGVTTVQGYFICKFVKKLVPIKYTKAGAVLQLVLSDLKVEQGKVPYFSIMLCNNLALDMNSAVENLKIHTNDLIVVHKPVVQVKKVGEHLSVGVGIVDCQVIDVWQHRSEAILNNLNLKSVSHCIKQLNIKSLKNLQNSTSEDSTEKIILSYFIKPSKFWKKEGQVVKAICFFKEIQPNGDVGFFFKMALHGSVARQFHQAMEDKSVVPDDIIAFVNPVILRNPCYKSDFILSDEPYFLEIGCRGTENIVFCKTTKIFQTQTEDAIVEKQITCSEPTSLACTQTDNIICDDNSLLLSPVSLAKVNKLSDYTYLIPISLIKPSKDLIDFENLNLVSGHCSKSCQKMFMYSEILWNVNKDPLCPKCNVLLQLCLCLEFQALSDSSRKLLKILLVDEKAETFLEVSCKEFLDSDEKRKTALKVLESKYVNGCEYKACKIKASDVSYVQQD